MHMARCKLGPLLAPAIGAIAVIGASLAAPAFADADMSRAPRESAAAPGAESVLAQLRAACPVLGHIVEEFALRDLGEVIPDRIINLRSGEIGIAAGFAAAGDIESMTRHAKSARDAGATKLEFKGLLYLTAVNAGADKAIEATHALSELLGKPGGNPVSLCGSRESATRPSQG